MPVQPSTSDPRPESFRIVGDQIQCLSWIGTENGTWRTRQEWIFRNPAWHFASVAELKAAQQRDGRSLGLVTPGRIDDVVVVKRSDQARREYESGMTRAHQQKDAFRPEYKELEFLSHDVVLRWRCLATCPECSSRPHKMKALDWGLLELGRRDGWEKARQKLMDIANVQTHDFRLFMGNFRLHPQTFGIIGLWYPRRRAQLDLI